MKKYREALKRNLWFLFLIVFFVLISIYSVSAQTTSTNTNANTNTSANSADLDNLVKKYSSTNSGTTASSIPTFSFPNIQPGSTVKGDISFKVNIPLIDGLTVYLIPEGSTVPKAQAVAQKTGADLWSINFNSKNVPDGPYSLAARIKNKTGEIEVAKVKINIANSPSTQGATPVGQQDVNAWVNSFSQADSQKLQENVNAFMDSLLTPEWTQKYFGKNQCDDKNTCGAMADPDHDNLVNVEEFRLGTDPTKNDSDSDGYLDGDEIKNGHDPLKPASAPGGDKMIFGSPKESGQLQSDILKVLDATSAQVSTNKTSVAISGKALPKSYVTLFIYSDMPTILTVETDDNGNWSYTLDKNIDDGTHQVYVAVTDNTGRITAKSQPLFFVKTAEAVNVIAPTEASMNEISSPVESRQVPYMILSLIIAAITLVLAIVIIGVRISHAKAEKHELDSHDQL